MTRRVYIATSLDNAAAHNALRDALEPLGISVSYDWTAHGSVSGQGAARLEQVAIAELRGIAEADLVVVLLPGRRGTHVEIGAALGRGVPLLLLDTTGDVFDADKQCAFYWVSAARRATVAGWSAAKIAELVDAELADIAARPSARAALRDQTWGFR